MAFNVFEALTAISTAATGLLVFLQYKTQRALSAAYLDGSISRTRNDELLVRLKIHPAELPVQFIGISARKAEIAKFKSIYEPGGKAQFSLDGGWLESLPGPIDVAPSRVSTSPVEIWFFIKPRSTESSALISLHTRVMWIPVRYKIKLPITINT
ncbi:MULTISPECIES: hypothetical protein [unclassified Janthinobacterium]|uniref:hypothetical protein n=1 Tax=unclassified Janthinobacterium TaxID=2610881 RepID=UPI00161C6488|nr:MULTISPECIES: hypothetical protein [unclassified Janthinobacterium]MBB5610397.1 hypothetical protein [Janthinobacterium sp. S3T4]MBB5615766.1 hypothetical protein [Janthinobacterium sp. S3M3]